jgi:hypothetical protein
MLLMRHFGVEPKEPPAILTHDHNKTRPVLMNSMDSVLAIHADGSPSAAKKFVKETVAMRKTWKLFCDTCHKTVRRNRRSASVNLPSVQEDKTKDGKMSVCKKCNTVGRQVRYCSR